MIEPAAWATVLMKSPQQLTLRDKVWRYKSEGNANVVLSVPADGTVVRVMKDETDDGGGETAAAVAAETLSVRLRFCDAVRRSFFADSRHVDVPVPMRVAADELREIDRLVRPHRPPGRKHKGLGWAGCLVAVCPDYTTLPPTDVPGVWCVEIKPKQGWVHEEDRACGPGGVRVKCPFCAHQYLKLCRGDVRRPSGYCPLDMFSGRRERVRRSVRALLRDPQNNLKLFLDGEPLVAPDDGFGDAASEALGDVPRFCALVAGALLGDYEDGGRNAPVMDGRDDTDTGRITAAASGALPCDFRAVPMPRHCVLHEILTMQRMQTAGFAAVCSEYDNGLRLSRDPHQFGHVDRMRPDGGDDAVAWSPVDGYLVAATARDCSVFVTFRGPGSSTPAVRVKVSDLDPKPLSTVDKHRIRDAKVSLACQRYSVG
ncbi:inositol-pentakisphosphate 2-kinase-like isoform X1 [Rhopalosiphum maidis]|uniref:inositol-pentakisphosphate 2-kinase-like isoform X1 n=1 Tax=Rhopalosiphum maidis TaxID=43146 RepID=UPI000F009514|nr:inositol-pentakisphosphate 2-kinase-like isoform X1 [Rhopalosiphum maidis]